MLQGHCAPRAIHKVVHGITRHLLAFEHSRSRFACRSASHRTACTAMSSDTKATLRKSMRQTLRGLDAETMATESEDAGHLVILNLAGTPGAAICANVLQSNVLRGARRVGVYVHCDKLREVDTSPLLDHLLSGTHVADFQHNVPSWPRHFSVLRTSRARQQRQHATAAPRWVVLRCCSHQHSVSVQTPSTTCSRCHHSTSWSRLPATATDSLAKTVCFCVGVHSVHNTTPVPPE